MGGVCRVGLQILAASLRINLSVANGFQQTTGARSTLRDYPHPRILITSVRVRIEYICRIYNTERTSIGLNFYCLVSLVKLRSRLTGRRPAGRPS